MLGVRKDDRGSEMSADGRMIGGPEMRADGRMIGGPGMRANDFEPLFAGKGVRRVSLAPACVERELGVIGWRDVIPG